MSVTPVTPKFHGQFRTLSIRGPKPVKIILIIHMAQEQKHFSVVIFFNTSQAYKSFYVFLLMVIYWTLDVHHPAVLAIMPIAFSFLMTGLGKNFVNEVSI